MKLKIIFLVIITTIIIAILSIFLFPNQILTKIIIYKLSQIKGSIIIYDKNKNIIFQKKDSSKSVNIYLNVNTNKFFFRIFKEKGNGLVKAYIDKWWYCDNMPKLITILVANSNKFNFENIYKKLEVMNS